MNVAPWNITGEEYVVSSLKTSSVLPLICGILIKNFDNGEQDLSNHYNGIDSIKGEGGPKR